MARIRSALVVAVTAVVLTPAMIFAISREPASAGSAVCPLPDDQILSRSDVPRGMSIGACDVTGRYVDLGRAVMPIPPSGSAVGMSRLTEIGQTTALIGVDDDGVVDYASIYSPAGDTVPRNDDDSTVDPRTGTRTDGCDYSGDTPVLNFKVDASGLNYVVGDGVPPAAGSQTDTAVAAKAAVSAWRNQQSPCTQGDYTYVPALMYAGTDSREGDFDLINGESDCGVPDHANTIDAGDLEPNGVVALTCWWLQDQPGADTVRYADIRLNTTDHNFTYHPLADSCSNAYDVQSILTHEIGHVLGIDDWYASAAQYQTMYGQAAGYKCKNYKRTLADGDVKALLVHY